MSFVVVRLKVNTRLKDLNLELQENTGLPGSPAWTRGKGRLS